MRESHTNKVRVPALDLLRLVAALGVVHFHWSGSNAGALPYGYLGVELFFMISGFVISMSIVGRTRWQFLQARTRRLWPTFFMCLLLSTAVANDPVSYSVFFANVTMIPKILGFNYVDGVYWSLMFEILFYLYVAIFVGENYSRLRFFAWIWLVIIFVPWPGKIATLVISAYAPFFIVGVAVYLRDWPLYLLSASVSAAFGYQHAYNDPKTAAFIIILCAIALQVALQLKFSQRVTSGLAIIGGTTYPLYLLHYTYGSNLPFSPPVSLLCVLLTSFLVWWCDRNLASFAKGFAWVVFWVNKKKCEEGESSGLNS